MLIIERRILVEGWKSLQDMEFKTFDVSVEIKDLTIIITYAKEYKVSRGYSFGVN